MITILWILLSLFISFLAIVMFLAIEVMDIRSGYRPDFTFIILISIVSMCPFLNFIIMIMSMIYLFKQIMNKNGYSQKLEDYIVKLVRGNND